MNASLTTRDQIGIRIGNVPLAWKLSALGAAVESVRLAHKDAMPAACWRALQAAEAALAKATLHAGRAPSAALPPPSDLSALSSPLSTAPSARA